MHALTFHGMHDLRYDRVPDPAVRAPTDAIVRVRVAAICGSDLHVWHGRETGLDQGTVMGHEFVGEVVDVGAGVRSIRRGDRVVAPFTTSCGQCRFCRIGLTARCVHGELFGWVERGRGLHGGQAELVRVPLADTTLAHLPAELADSVGLLLGDVLATGYHAARLAEAGPGRVCAVVGCGPVGLMAVLAARTLGAETVFAVDSVPERLAFAERLGALPLPSGEDAVPRAREATQGFGVDAVLECVGSPAALRFAFDALRPGGTLASVGVHHEAAMPFSPGEAYDRNLTFRSGRCPARAYLPSLLPIALRHGPILAALFTHQLPLADAPAGYALFADRAGGCVKVALRP
jgi:threonine dehydrogenase-like Zn-dependent dehydrogenase